MTFKLESTSYERERGEVQNVLSFDFKNTHVSSDDTVTHTLEADTTTNRQNNVETFPKESTHMEYIPTPTRTNTAQHYTTSSGEDNPLRITPEIEIGQTSRIRFPSNSAPNFYNI